MNQHKSKPTTQGTTTTAEPDQPRRSHPSVPPPTPLQGGKIKTQKPVTTLQSKGTSPLSSPPQTSSNRLTNKQFVDTITTILRTELPPIQPSPFKFTPTREAAEWNKQVITFHGGLEQAIQHHRNSPTSYGSEFRPVWCLHLLMRLHPLWPETAKRIGEGSTFPLDPIPEADRIEDLKAALVYKNHKSADENETFIDTMTNEIRHGWALPLPPDFATSIPEAAAAPHGIISQHTINERGEILDKNRMTHDQSFPGAVSKTSVNSRVRDEDLIPCLYGHANTRCIHYIVGCRQRHPNTRIWLSKVDWKSAYRRQHLNATTAVKSLTQVLIDGIWFLIMALRLTFGGKPCPSEWGSISEPVADLATDLLNCRDWDPTSFRTPQQHLLPTPSPLPDDIPFAPARETFVSIPAEDNGKVDCYIDDKLAMGLDLPGAIPRLENCILLALHIFFRPLSPVEPLPREEAAATAKLKAEGGLEEIKTFLGWVYNTRTLRISLPDHKFKAWSKDLESLLSSKTTTASSLESTIGRLNHVGYLIPTARHFLSRLRKLQKKAQFRRHTPIPNLVLEDIKLWGDFLRKANEGISMNLITFRKPTHTYRSDACEHGLGGFSEQGFAWRWEIPQKLRGRAHINLLEFLASIVCIWIDAAEDRISDESCLLSMGDSTTATGWMRRSNFQPVDESDTDTTAKLNAARTLAKIVQDQNSCLYSQWFPGKENVLADSLSRDHHFSPTHLTTFLHLHIPQQLPKNFQLVPLRQEINSWLCSLLAKMPEKQERLVPPKTSELVAGLAGKNSSPTSNWATTPSSPPSTTQILETSSSVLSHKLSGKQPTLPNTSPNLPKGLFEPPSTMWHRPSGLVTGQTPDSTMKDEWLSLCHNNTKGTRMETQTQNPKKPSPSPL